MANEWLKQACNEIKHLQSGETFLVKELFKGYLWNRISKSERLTLGTLFLNYAQNDGRALIEPLGKSSANQQIYKRN